MALEPHGQSLEALHEQEGAERRKGRTGVAETDGAAADGVGRVREVPRVDDAVEGRLGQVEHREPVGMLGPGEAPGVDNRAAERRAVAPDELRQRMDDDVGTVLDRLQVQRRRDRVVDDERHPVSVRDIADGLQVDDVERRIADRLAEDGFGVGVHQPLDALGAVVLCETHLDALTRQHVGEQRVGGPVQLRCGDDVVVDRREVQDRVVDRGRPGTEHDGTGALLESRDPVLQHVIGGVVETVVVEPGRLEVEDGSGVGGVVEFVGDRLVDGHGDRARLSGV